MIYLLNQEGNILKLYLVHCGFYDQSFAEETKNIFEGHHNFYVAANSTQEAKRKVKAKRLFQEKKMHVDGFHEISQVDGYEISLKPTEQNRSRIEGIDYNEAKKL